MAHVPIMVVVLTCSHILVSYCILLLLLSAYNKFVLFIMLALIMVIMLLFLLYRCRASSSLSLNQLPDIEEWACKGL